MWGGKKMQFCLFWVFFFKKRIVMLFLFLWTCSGDRGKRILRAVHLDSFSDSYTLTFKATQTKKPLLARNDAVMRNVHNPGENKNFILLPLANGCYMVLCKMLLSLSHKSYSPESFGCPLECRNRFSNYNTEAFSPPTDVIKFYNQNIGRCYCCSNREMWPFGGMMRDRHWDNGQIVSMWLNPGKSTGFNITCSAAPCCAWQRLTRETEMHFG